MGTRGGEVGLEKHKFIIKKKNIYIKKKHIYIDIYSTLHLHLQGLMGKNINPLH